MAVAIVFSLAFFLLSVVRDDPWEDHAYDQASPVAAGMPAPHRDGREKMVCSSCHEIIKKKGGRSVGGGTPPIARGAPAPATHNDGRDKRVCSSCHQFAKTAGTSAQNGVPPIARGEPAPANHKGGRDKRVCSSCHAVLEPSQLQALKQSRKQATPPIRQGQLAPATHNDGRSKRVCTSCHILTPANGAAGKISKPNPGGAQAVPIAWHGPLPPLPQTTDAAFMDPEWHERFRPLRFQGKVLRVVDKSPRSGRENLHILVHDNINTPQWINVAPSWFLREEGCMPMPGTFVKGTAYKEMGVAPGSLRYAGTLSVNGEFCMIRNNHLVGAWIWPDGEEMDEE
uniref:Putative magnetosome protein MamX n=1 Tax=Magnetococcus massalia (strain MO-1) TaxID=451514 RepID=A0A1S7LF68_MAGMO|nr:Putative magnetosome protein MamX [Candidatus Magnetococcus massalia]